MRITLRDCLRALLIVASSLAVAEGLANVFYARQHGRFFYSASAKADRSETRSIRALGVAAPDQSFEIHPFFGYALRPGVSVFQHLSRGGRDARSVLESMTQSAVLPAWADTTSNNFGFFSPLDYPTRAQDGFVVGVFGGSVAQWFVLQAGARLVEHLAALPALSDRPITVLNFALASYKQPQQAAVLSYALSVGQRFDVVINIDGFNEAALGRLNYQEGVEASLPATTVTRGFEAIVSAQTDGPSADYLGRLASLRSRIRQEMARVERAPIALVGVLSQVRLHRLRRAYAVAAADPPEVPTESTRLLYSSPPLAPEGANVTSLADQWYRASRLMGALAEKSGSVYIHALQPNQYFGDRVMLPEERATAWAEDSPYRPAVETTYPVFQAFGRRLSADGVRFLDLTGVFDGIGDAVYADNCCHYNQAANEVLAVAVVEELRRVPLLSP